MGMNLKFSIVIPIHNSEAFLKRAIDSVINQEYDNYELILVDDRSTDNSFRICESYTRSNTNVVLFKNEGLSGGVSKVRNIGIDNSTGDLLLFLDSDDYFYNGLLKQIATSYDSESDMLFFGYNRLNHKGKIFKKKNYADRIIDRNDIGECIDDLPLAYAWGIAYKLRLIKNNHLSFDESMSLAEDTVFVHNCLVNVGKKIQTIHFYGLAYTCNNPHSLSIKYVPDIERLYDKVYESQKTLEFYSPYKVPYTKVQLITLAVINNIFASSSPLSKKEKRKALKKVVCDDYTRKEMLGLSVRTKFDLFIKIAFRLKMVGVIAFAYSTFKKH